MSSDFSEHRSRRSRELTAEPNAVFTKLAAGALDAANFCQGSAALQADDYILYNQTTDILAYDADGNGANAAVQFALLSNNATLTL